MKNSPLPASLFNAASMYLIPNSPNSIEFEMLNLNVLANSGETLKQVTRNLFEFVETYWHSEQRNVSDSLILNSNME